MKQVSLQAQQLHGSKPAISVSSHACRPGCGACCIAPSISSAIPGMPSGKPAGVRCIQLTEANQCAIFGLPERPSCCSGLTPEEDMCGSDREYAIHWLTSLEELTRPGSQSRQ
ncbi:YkgJ family cysteine cluster protein [Undibacterium terreum]|uniref:YkgJ family cysteine cluster protein n=1 Tax=Undibacterium terreum TaxID=1224302 RepID=UPI0016696256|nr:YkgJ family cysteine cluster protein [Undibacterium terreum]